MPKIIKFNRDLTTTVVSGDQQFEEEFSKGTEVTVLSTTARGLFKINVVFTDKSFAVINADDIELVAA